MSQALSPELAGLIAQLSAPLPVHTCYRDLAGRVRPLVKDCSCETHAGPHWLHADRSYREANRRMITDHPESVSYLTLMGFAQEESARCKQKLWAMRAHGIAELLTEEQVLALQSAGEAVAA